MYKLASVPHDTLDTYGNKEHKSVSDFAKIKERLSIIGICEKNERFQVYKKLLDDVSQIIKISVVENAIKYTKNRLLDADGTDKIEGEKFEYYKCFVDNLIKKIIIENVLRRYDSYKPYEDK